MTSTVTGFAVLACGMTTAVGLTAPAACAAIRGRITGFTETAGTALDGSPIIGAPVPMRGRGVGVQKLARLVEGPIHECLAGMPDCRTEDIPLLLGVAEPDRPGRPEELDVRLLALVEEELGCRLHPASRLIPHGRSAGAVALQEAARLLRNTGLQLVLVAGTDSYLTLATLDALDDQKRLLTERNSDGFIPGEAGAAILLGRPTGDPCLLIRSSGSAMEVATMASGLPMRGEGLAVAYRQALASAGIQMEEIDYRIADCSGEQYWFKEAALAFLRVNRARRDLQDLWHPADCIGETGAAALPCILGVAWWAAAKHYAPGPLALAQSCGDDGRRVAFVLEALGTM